jgi:hypothetical protein
VDGETKTRASLGVSIGEGHTLGLKGSATGDGKLVASNVVLSTTSSAGSVESNSLSPEQVVTRSDVGWDLEVELSAYLPLVYGQSKDRRILTVVVHVFGSPEIGIALA